MHVLKNSNLWCSKSTMFFIYILIFASLYLIARTKPYQGSHLDIAEFRFDPSTQ